MSQVLTPSSRKAKTSRMKKFQNAISFESALLAFSKLGSCINNWSRAPSKDQIRELIDVCVKPEDVELGEKELTTLILTEFRNATRDFEEEEETHSKGKEVTLTDGIKEVLQRVLTKENLNKPLSDLKNLLVTEIDVKVQEIKQKAESTFQETIKTSSTNEILEQLVYKFNILEDQKFDALKMYEEVLEDNKGQKKRIKDLMDELAAERAKNTKSTGNDFEGELRRRTDELQELQRKFDKVNPRVKELEDMNAKQKKEIQRLTGENDSKRLQIDRLTEEIDDHNAKMREKDGEIESLERDIKDLKNKIETLTADKSTLEKSLAAEKEELHRNLTALEQYRDDLYAYKQRRGILKDKLAIDIDPELDEPAFQKQMTQILKVFKDKDALERELDSLKKDMEALRKDNERKDQEIKELKEEIERLKKLLKEKEDELNQAGSKDEIERLTRQLARKDEDIKRLQEDKARSEKQIADLQAQIAELKGKIRDLEAELAKEKDRYNQLEKNYNREISYYQNRFAQLEKEKKDVQANLVEAQREIQRLKDQLSNLGAYELEIADLKAQRKRLLEDLEVANRDVEKLKEIERVNRAEINNVRDERDNIRRAKAEVEARIDDLNRRIKSLENDKSRLEEELARLRKSAELAQQEAAEARSERDQMKGQRDDALDKLKTANRNNENLTDLNKALSLELDQLRGDRNLLQNQIDELEAMIRELQRARDGLARDKTFLERQLKAVQDAAQNAGRDLEDANYENLKLKKQRDDLLDELTKANRHVAELSDVATKRGAELEMLNKLKPDLSKYQSKAQELEQERAKLQKRLQETEKELTKALDEKSNFERAYANANDRAKEAERTLRIAEKERDDAAQKENTLRGEADALARKLAAAEKDRDHFKNLFNVQMARATDLYAQGQKHIYDIRKLQEEIDRLKVKLPILEMERGLLADQIAALRAEIDALEKQKEQYRKSADRLEVDNRELAFLKDKVTEELKALREALFNEDDQKEKQVALANELAGKLDQNVEKLSKLASEKENLFNERDFLASRLSNIESNYGSISQPRQPVDGGKKQTQAFDDERSYLKTEIERLKLKNSQVETELGNKISNLQTMNTLQEKAIAELKKENLKSQIRPIQGQSHLAQSQPQSLPSQPLTKIEDIPITQSVLSPTKAQALVNFAFPG